MVATGPWVHLPRLTAELAEGWTAAESAVFTSPAGLSIAVTTSRPPEGAGPPQLAEEHLPVLAEELTGFAETAVAETTALGGVPAVRRKFTFDRDGIAWCGCISYAIVDGVVCTLSAGWPAELPGGRAEQDFEIAARGLRLMPDFARPAGARSTVANGGVMPASAKRPVPVERAVWHQLRNAWSAEPSHIAVGAELGSSTRWSPEELQLCATLLGAAAFPTVDPEVLLAQPEATRSAVLGSTGRSLVARQLLHAEDGRAVLPTAVVAVLEPAVFPDLAVQAQRFDALGVQTWWFGVRDDRAVEVAVNADGSRTCASLPPAALLRRIAAVTGLGECRTGTDAARAVQPERIFDPGSDLNTVVRIWTLWQEGTTSVGGVLQWAIDARAGLYWVAEESDHAETRWHLEPTDVASAQLALLAHLPGGDRQ